MSKITAPQAITYERGSPLLRYPGSPSQMTIEHLLDISKYRGDALEYNGQRVTKYCINHPDKRSSNYVLDSERVKSLTGIKGLKILRGVCDSCCLTLVRKGFNEDVKEISLAFDENHDEEIKKEQLQLFLGKSKGLQEKIHLRISQHEYFRNQVIDHYNNQKQILIENEE